jgi:pilus assembly protein Flp/PilA
MIENLRNLIVSLHVLRAEKRDERGASAVEYGLLVAGIAALVVVVVFALGNTISGAFSETDACIAGDGAAATC